MITSVFLQTLRGFLFQKHLLMMQSSLIAGLWFLFLVTQSSTLSMDMGQRRGWVWCAVAWGLFWEAGFYMAHSTQALLEQYMIHVRTMMPLLLGTWVGHWLFCLLPVLCLMHYGADIPMHWDILILGSGLLGSLSLNFFSLTCKEHRWAGVITCIPLVVPILIVCVHPLEKGPFPEGWLSPNGWVLLGLWGLLIPVNLWANHALLKKSLSFPVLLLHSKHAA